MKHRICLANVSPTTNKKGPPRRNPGDRENPIRWRSALERVTALPVRNLGGGDGQAHFPGQNARDKASNRVSLPTGGLHQIRTSGAPRAHQQVENLCCLGSLTGVRGLSCRLGRLCAPVGFLRWGNPFGRLALRRGHVARTSGDTGLFGRGWLPGRGADLGIGDFWNIVHLDFSFCGDYREHMNHSGSLQLQADCSGNPQRLEDDRRRKGEFGLQIGADGGRW